MPTTQISLIREHTEVIKPPRALWVPFELGRPLGAPGNAGFQRRVLRACLRLLEAGSGPVLEDFPEDVPAGPGGQAGAWACPVSFSPAEKEPVTESERLAAMLRDEVGRLRPWYDLSVKNRGRTTVGPSGLDMEAICALFEKVLSGRTAESPRRDLGLAEVLKLAAEDLKAYYLEAAAAQPGPAPTSAMLADWFWEETVAGRVFARVRDICLGSDDAALKIFGQLLLVPLERTARAR